MKFKCIYKINDFDEKHLAFHKADVPQKDCIYTLKKIFFYVGYSFKECKYAIHFEELNHGSLIGYDVKYFLPVNEFGQEISNKDFEIPLSKEDNPKWIIKDGIIISNEEYIN